MGKISGPGLTIFRGSLAFYSVAESERVSRSVVSGLCDPMDLARQAPPSMGFSRQEHWNGLPFPSLWDLPDPGIKLGSPALQVDSLPSEPPGKPRGGEEGLLKRVAAPSGRPVPRWHPPGQLLTGHVPEEGRLCCHSGSPQITHEARWPW